MARMIQFAFSSWHMNLGFSAIETKEHQKVLDNCYWPLLELASLENNKFGIEASASTLELIERIDPLFITKVANLHKGGKLEIIASGWSQIIAPLVPWKVTMKNLEIGNEYYSSVFDSIPKVAFVNEQAWSDGLTELYLDSGFESVIVEWENAYQANPEWLSSSKFRPALLNYRNRGINLIWNSSTAFQKLQRLAHFEESKQDWVTWLRTMGEDSRGGSLCIYGGDVETIGYRPKRYIYETNASAIEWVRIGEAFQNLEGLGITQVLPSELISLFPPAKAIGSVASAKYPIPTKKQPKYNPLRWAVGGRDSVLINTKCQQIYESLSSLHFPDSRYWKELLELWASDFRTHITDSRWNDWHHREKNLRKALNISVISRETHKTKKPSGAFLISSNEKDLEIKSSSLKLNLNKGKGLALEKLQFNSLGETWAVGTFSHGLSDSIEWNADFYSGELVLELPGDSKISDLLPVNPEIAEFREFLFIKAQLNSNLGILEKKIRIYPNQEKVEIEYTLVWPEIPIGSLRFGDVVINPKLFDLHSLHIQTHNGGYALERFDLGSTAINHGQPWSALVSAQQCFGMTEGFLLVGDNKRQLKISTDSSKSKVPALLTFCMFEKTYLLRIQFSGRETDDTTKSKDISLGSEHRSFQITIESWKGSNDEVYC